MAEIATIARPYAEALFRVAGGRTAPADASVSMAAWSGLLEEMTLLVQNDEIKSLVQNPKISANKVAEIFLSALKSAVTPEAKNFIHTLASYQRLLLLPEITAQFIVLKNAREGAADAHISSAFALTDEQVKDLCTLLERKFGRKLNPDVTVDASLIGGVRVVVGDEVLDTSVRARLQQMQTALTV